MKTLLKVLSALCVLLLAMAFVACGSPDEIYFTKDNTPRQTYVQGQELDFTDISLTAKTKDKTELVPMDSADVSVTGYDKDTLGEQTVTISYKEKTTTIKVNVIPRLTVEGYDKNYFVNDSFNNQNGIIKVANDNAEISNINLSSEAVLITGFDSSTVGENV